MQTLRNLAAAPFLIVGVVVAWTGLALTRLGYVIGGGAHEGNDPLGLFNDDRKYSID